MPMPPQTPKFFLCRLSCTLVAALSFLAVSARAENQVLFIGNSFTMGAGASVATIFDRLAIAGGQDDPTTVMRAVGGQGYDFHVADAASQAEIASRPWTHVVMQNYSTRPTHIGDIADHFASGTELYDQIMANRDATQVVLFETWSRAANHGLITGTSTPTSFASTAQMQSELRDNYGALADALNAANPGRPPVVVGRVGDAWENAGGLLAESHPDFADLHGSDNYHGNDNGYYLAAAVFYSVIYAASAEGLETHSAVTSLGLNLTEEAGDLGRIAWETTAGNVPLEFSAQPDSVNVPEHHLARFSAAVVGSTPYTVQWSRDGDPVPGADRLVYEIPAADAALDGSIYTVTVTNAVSTITSAGATLTITSDTEPPVLDGATSPDGASIELEFSEPLALADPAHYVVTNRGEFVPVLGAELSPDGTSVVLALGGEVTGRFVVGVDPAATDLSGNPIASNTLVIGSAPDPSDLEVLIDFGSSATPSDSDGDPPRQWNNVTQSIGGADSGRIGELLAASGGQTGIGLDMIRRFNGANTNGTQASALFPASATGDSLFGNTETFSGLSNVFPAFKFSGLDPATPYSIIFYASRNGVGDNRSTDYTVTGATVAVTTFNPANNTDASSTLEGLLPSAAGELMVELSPAPANTNSNHFTYLGTLVLRAAGAAEPAGSVPEFYSPLALGGWVVIDWMGSGDLESSDWLAGGWAAIGQAVVPPYLEAIPPGGRKFFRLSFDLP